MEAGDRAAGDGDGSRDDPQHVHLLRGMEYSHDDAECQDENQAHDALEHLLEHTIPLFEYSWRQGRQGMDSTPRNIIHESLSGMSSGEKRLIDDTAPLRPKTRRRAKGACCLARHRLREKRPAPSRRRRCRPRKIQTRFYFAGAYAAARASGHTINSFRPSAVGAYAAARASGHTINSFRPSAVGAYAAARPQ
jgi:hypothetical protein